VSDVIFGFNVIEATREAIIKNSRHYYYK